MSILKPYVITPIEPLELTEEGQQLQSISLETIILDQAEREKYTIYIVLTDTKTIFSRLSRIITQAEYNHISISLTKNLDTLYTYVLINKNGLKGGLVLEDRKRLKGAKYLLYSITLSKDSYNKFVTTLEEQVANIHTSRYNHLGLINTIFKKEIFKSYDETKMICSQFVYRLFERSGIELIKNQSEFTIRPYDFIKSDLLKFVGQGRFD